MAESVVPVAIVGASGYTGAELVRLLLGHPRVRLVGAYARRAAGSLLSDVFPQFAGRMDLPIGEFDADEVAKAARVAFTALPHADSAAAGAALRERGVRVLDLSADFRLHDADTYCAWYADHPAPELLPQAVYGLPELHRDALRGASLVACPGCYPTGAVLALAPLLARGLIEPDGLIIDSKSGTSGAGRSPAQATMLSEAGEGMRAYKVAGTHRHTPEIEQELGELAGRPLRVVFTPHLTPMSRGIFTCAYATPTAVATAAVLQAAIEDAYRDEPFVTALAAGRIPDTAHVRGSNRAHVAVALDERAGRVLAMSAIDNLVKGASGQAIQCMNLALGWDETLGLDHVGMFP